MRPSHLPPGSQGASSCLLNVCYVLLDTHLFTSFGLDLQGSISRYFLGNGTGMDEENLYFSH